MIWNTIAHPRMMHRTDGGAGDVDDSVVFGAEVLESPIKHMNRDLLATFDFIVMELLTPAGVLKFVPILGNFETVYRAAKNKTAVSTMSVKKFVTTVERDGKSVAVPDDSYPLDISTAISMPDAFEGRIDMKSISVQSGIADFKNDRFVVCNPGPAAIVLSSYGETYESRYWFNTILPKYKVAEGETEEGGR